MLTDCRVCSAFAPPHGEHRLLVKGPLPDGNWLTAGCGSHEKNNIIVFKLFVKTDVFAVDKTNNRFAPAQADFFKYFFQPGTLLDLEVNSRVRVVVIYFSESVQTPVEFYFNGDVFLESEHLAYY